MIAERSLHLPAMRNQPSNVETTCRKCHPIDDFMMRGKQTTQVLIYLYLVPGKYRNKIKGERGTFTRTFHESEISRRHRQILLSDRWCSTLTPLDLRRSHDNIRASCFPMLSSFIMLPPVDPIITRHPKNISAACVHPRRTPLHTYQSIFQKRHSHGYCHKKTTAWYITHQPRPPRHRRTEGNAGWQITEGTSHSSVHPTSSSEDRFTEIIVQKGAIGDLKRDVHVSVADFILADGYKERKSEQKSTSGQSRARRADAPLKKKAPRRAPSHTEEHAHHALMHRGFRAPCGWFPWSPVREEKKEWFQHTHTRRNRSWVGNAVTIYVE